MASAPIITFKAGRCSLEGKKVKPEPEPGYVYLYRGEDELIRFCWRKRADLAVQPQDELTMVPGDATFTPFLEKSTAESQDKHSPTNGRIYVLKFSSSSDRHYFWMQAKSQHKDGSLSWFSSRDQKIGQVINELLSGEEVDVEAQLGSTNPNGGGDNNGDAMQDVQESNGAASGGGGGAGQDATGGDPREEGEESRRGGEDGGRAASANPNDVVQNFLRSLQNPGAIPSNLAGQSQRRKPFASLTDLLATDTTLPVLESADPAQINRLCTLLPASLFIMAQETEDSLSSVEPTPERAQAAIEALSTEQKREILKRVLRSPQLHQSLDSLTIALHDGGLPQISEALGVKPANGGFVRGSSMPLGGDDAVEAFLEGVKKHTEKS